jgi:hypothetical protein
VQLRLTSVPVGLCCSHLVGAFRAPPPLATIARGDRSDRRPIVLSRTHPNTGIRWHSSRLAHRGCTRTVRPAALSDVRPQDRRQPPGSGDRFAALGREHSQASSGRVAIAEIVAHTACAKRPRGPVLASRQHPRPSLAPRRLDRRRASARKSRHNLFRGLRGPAEGP